MTQAGWIFLGWFPFWFAVLGLAVALVILAIGHAINSVRGL